MNQPTTRIGNAPPAVSASLEPAEPLWKRVPTTGDDGRPLSDFMMLIPKLRTRTAAQVKETLDNIQTVFAHYRHAVVFADLNLPLNLLWVSVKPIPGICLELPAALKAQIPEAVLVAPKAEAMMGQRWSKWRRS